MGNNKLQQLLLMVMLLLISVTGIIAFFRMNPRSLNVVLSPTQGLSMRIEGDGLSSDSKKTTVYVNPRSVILPTEKDDWLIIQSVKGKDKSGNEALFDFYTLFGVNDGYVWKYGSWDWVEDISTNQQIRVDRFFSEKFGQQGIRERISKALDVISVGVASCEGSNMQKEEDRAFNRAKSIRKFVKSVATTTRGETSLLLLGQNIDDKCPQKSPDETRDQRSIIIIGVVLKDHAINLQEAVANAMTNLVSNENLKQDLEKYIKNPSRSPLGNLDPKRYSRFDLVN
jgi:hypothetical protein